LANSQTEGSTDKLTMAALCAGHFVSDSYSSIIFPLLPLIKDALHLTTAQVFWLAPLYAISSSLMQPVYGAISDRYARRSFAVFGPAITATFISMIGLAPSYGVLLLILIAGGVGIGSFHPQAAAMASAAAGSRRRLGLAMFSATGTIGYSLGPLGIAVFTSHFGLGKTYYVIGLGYLMSAILFRVCPALSARSATSEPRTTHEGGPSGLRGRSSGISIFLPVWRPLLLLYLITVFRSGLQLTTNNYLPFILRSEGHSVTQSGAVITVFLLLGGVGGIAGGFIAERVPGKAVTLYSGLIGCPLMMAAFLTHGAASVVLLGLGGFALLSAIPVNVAMAQELIPGRTSTVSALMMGAAWGVGALAPPLLDNLVPAIGFRNVLALMSAVTMLTVLFAYLLPADRHLVRRAPSELVPVSGD
jgi:FSR family fosmidomycin resistance protein-like MFS transporter